MTAHRAALAAYCADRRVKLVHVWQTAVQTRYDMSSSLSGERRGSQGDAASARPCWSAMVEWPYEPNKRVPTERHATGVGDDPVSATVAALDYIGFGGIGIRVYVLGYMMGLR